MHQIDYGIKTLEERMLLVDKILEEQRDSIEKYFGNSSTNYLLQKLANYLLNCECQQKHKEKMQRKFENSTLELTDAPYTLNNKIKITKNDYKNDAIREKRDLIVYVYDNYGQNNKAKRWIQDLKYDQVAIKQSEHGYIKPKFMVPPPLHVDQYEIDNYWKDIFEINSIHHPLNLDLFEVDSWKIILKLLPFYKKISGNVDRLIKLFNKAYHLCDFTPFQKNIIREFQCGGATKFDDFIIVRNVDVANKLNKIEVDIFQNVEFICNKLIKVYEMLFTEYYYTFLVRGTYKRCKKCGKNKIIQDFKVNSSSKDNRYSICKCCEKEIRSII